MRLAMRMLRRRLHIDRIERASGQAVSDSAIALFLVQLCADPQRSACVTACEESEGGATGTALPFWHPFCCNL